MQKNLQDSDEFQAIKQEVYLKPQRLDCVQRDTIELWNYRFGSSRNAIIKQKMNFNMSLLMAKFNEYKSLFNFFF